MYIVYVSIQSYTEMLVPITGSLVSVQNRANNLYLRMNMFS